MNLRSNTIYEIQCTNTPRALTKLHRAQEKMNVFQVDIFLANSKTMLRIVNRDKSQQVSSKMPSQRSKSDRRRTLRLVIMSSRPHKWRVKT